jgi:predicted DNA-binding protein
MAPFAMPPKLTNSETMAIRIQSKAIRKLRTLADKTERTIAWHVRKAIERYLEQEGKK